MPFTQSLFAFISEGADYTMVNSVLTLNASGDPACVDVATTGDDVLENDETFFVSLTSADSAVMFSASTATVVISNDGKCLKLSL